MAVTSSSGKYRTGKTHLYHADGSGVGGYGFDTLSQFQAYWLTDVAASDPGTAALAKIPILQDCVIVKVGWSALAVTSTAATDNLVQVQIQTGTGMEEDGLTFTASGATPVAAQTYPAANSANNFLFATAQNFFATAGGTDDPMVTVVAPDIPESWVAAGSLVVMQVKATSAGGVTNPIIFCLLVAQFDPKQYASKGAVPITNF